MVSGAWSVTVECGGSDGRTQKARAYWMVWGDFTDRFTFPIQKYKVTIMNKTNNVPKT